MRAPFSPLKPAAAFSFTWPVCELYLLSLLTPLIHLETLTIAAHLRKNKVKWIISEVRRVAGPVCAQASAGGHKKQLLAAAKSKESEIVHKLMIHSQACRSGIK